MAHELVCSLKQSYVKIAILCSIPSIVSRTFHLPIVRAAKKKEQGPKKPCRTGYKELPIMETPHADYLEYKESHSKCPKYKVKILHDALLPHVSDWRKTAFDYQRKYAESLHTAIEEIKEDANSTAHEIKSYLRHPDNSDQRVALVGFSTVMGHSAFRKKSSPMKMLGLCSGAILSGMLCYPKETNAVMRVCAFQLLKVMTGVYNLVNKSHVRWLDTSHTCNLPDTKIEIHDFNKCGRYSYKK